MLKVKNLCQSYKNGNEVYKTLKNVSFEIKEGEFVAVMGPSGSGKSTLLNCISSFISYDSGEIDLNGTKISELDQSEIAEIRNKKLGFVFQDFMLLDGLTVFENVCVPIQLAYAIGMEIPVSVFVETFGTSEISDETLVDIVVREFDLSPSGIIKMLHLNQPLYSRTSVYGHFGNDLNLPWERLDKVEELKKYREVV